MKILKKITEKMKNPEIFIYINEEDAPELERRVQQMVAILLMLGSALTWLILILWGKL